MYKSPLLQTPLPQPKRPLPDIYTVREDVTGRDETRIGVRGFGTMVIPRMVQEAVEELTGNIWQLNEDERRRWPNLLPQAILVLCCRYHEMGYVDYERVASSATPSQSSASASA